MKKTILMYWPKEGNVEFCAKLIAKEYQDIEIKSIDEVNIDDIKNHPQLIIGCSTVGSETWRNADNSDPWSAFMKQMEDVNMTDKSVALFGLGDQIRWPKHYVDGMAVLHEQISSKGAKMVGKWFVEGYDHEESEAQEGDYFLGLALDEDHQPELSEGRVEKWVKQIKKEF